MNQEPPELLGEKSYRPVILRMSKESGMLNSMTESSFSLLFSRSSSSCKSKRPTQRGKPGAPHLPEEKSCPSSSSRTISACFTVRGKPSSRKPFLQGGVSRLFSISSTTISSLTCKRRDGCVVNRQQGLTCSCPQSSCTCASTQPAPEPSYGQSQSQRQNHRSLL